MYRPPWEVSGNVRFGVVLTRYSLYTIHGLLWVRVCVGGVLSAVEEDCSPNTKEKKYSSSCASIDNRDTARESRRESRRLSVTSDTTDHHNVT